MTFPFPFRALAEAGAAPARAVPQLVIEARKARAFGKPLAAALMMALARVLPRVPELFDRIEHWPGDLASDGVVFRLNAGLHALARSGQAGALERLYGISGPAALVSPDRLDAALVAVLQEHHAALAGWLAHPTQTNETLRVAGLVAALLELEQARAAPSEVLELGASAGLNLNFPHYAVQLGEAAVCAPDSAVRLRPEWRGAALPAAPLTIPGARGVDLHPLDVSDPEDHERLRAYVWPGETARAARLEAAIGLARRVPPRVEAGLASAWLARALAVPQPAGVRRVVFHSMVLQYAAPSERAAIDTALGLAGAIATPDRPLARVSIEWRADRAAVEIRIAEWDGHARSGTLRLAAVCHPYGEWIDWLGLRGPA